MAIDFTTTDPGPPRAQNPHESTVDYWLKQRALIQPALRWASHVDTELAAARRRQREWDEQHG